MFTRREAVFLIGAILVSLISLVFATPVVTEKIEDEVNSRVSPIYYLVFISPDFDRVALVVFWREIYFIQGFLDTPKADEISHIKLLMYDRNFTKKLWEKDLTSLHAVKLPLPLGITWSPDSSKIAMMSLLCNLSELPLYGGLVVLDSSYCYSELKVLSSDDGSVLFTWNNNEIYFFIDMSVNNAAIVIWNSTDAIVLSSSDGTILWQFSDLGINTSSLKIKSVALAPDATKVAVLYSQKNNSSFDLELMVASLVDNSVLWQKNLSTEYHEVKKIAWSFDGSIIAALGDTSSGIAVISLDASDGEEIQRKEITPYIDLNSLSYSSFSPKGDRLGIATYYSTYVEEKQILYLYLINVLNGSVTTVPLQETKHDPVSIPRITWCVFCSEDIVVVDYYENYLSVILFFVSASNGTVVDRWEIDESKYREIVEGSFKSEYLSAIVRSALVFVNSFLLMVYSAASVAGGGFAASVVGVPEFKLWVSRRRTKRRYAKAVSRMVKKIKSNRDVSDVSRFLKEFEHICSKNKYPKICAKLGKLRSLLDAVRQINSMVTSAEDDSISLVERVRILKKAEGICRSHSIKCKDLKGKLRRIERELNKELAKITLLLKLSYNNLSNGKVSLALSKLSEARTICDRIGQTEECKQIHDLLQSIKSVIQSLNSSVIDHEVDAITSTIKLKIRVPPPSEVPANSPPIKALINKIPEGIKVITPAAEARLVPNAAPELALAVKSHTATKTIMPINICWGDYCVKRSAVLKAPKPQELTTPKRPARVSVADARRLLGLGLEGLVGGYGCVGESFAVRLRRGIVPAGFEGEAECRLLGCGGWGCAYLCRRGGEPFVVKVPRGFEGIVEGGFAPTVHERLLRRIRDTAEAVRALRHPNILRLLGVAEHAPVLVYEFAEHGSLEWQLSRGWRPSLRDVVLVGIQVGDALRYIHSRGLVHGDIKPGNVFVVNGVAKVGDFSSLVRLVTMSSRMSRFAYTPGFRAPEQAFADLRRRVRELGIENRIDVYLLGNLLLYLLTGESVDGEEAIGTNAVEEAVREVEDEDLRKLIASALSTEPEERPTMDEVVRELLRIWMSRGW